MGDEREREMSRPSLADAIDLLDLVRGAEDSARISMDSLSSPPVAAAPSPMEDFVDVGDEAEDVAPSVAPIGLETLDPALLPPELQPKPAKAAEAKIDAAKVDAAKPSEVPPSREQARSPSRAPVKVDDAPEPVVVASATTSEQPPAGSPISGILLVFGLVIAGLAGICALPSDPPAAPPAAKAALRTEPANLQVERNAEDRVEGVQDDVAREPGH